MDKAISLIKKIQEHWSELLVHLTLLILSILVPFEVFPVRGRGFAVGLVHLGVGITVYTSFWGAFDFCVKQAVAVPSWLASINFSALCGSALLCLFALALDTSSVISTAMVHGALSLFIVFDVVALQYFKKHWRAMYEQYRRILWLDVIVFGIYSLLYLFLFPKTAGLNHDQILESRQESELAVASLKSVALYSELLIIFFLPTITREVLSVEEGYRLWAPNYDKGNAIMQVERRHTVARIRELNVGGTIIDVGCGTGFYSEILAGQADKLIAIDPSAAMLERFRARVGGRFFNIEIWNVPSYGLRDLQNASVDLIVCCLVIDHLDSYELQTLASNAFLKLKAGGRFYITDVNSFFEEFRQPYAKFIDTRGVEQRIEVKPHTVSSVQGLLTKAGFSRLKVQDVHVSSQDVTAWSELEDMTGRVLIVEYLATKA